MDISVRHDFRFRSSGFPTDLFDDGILDVRLPVPDEFVVGGTEIEVQS